MERTEKLRVAVYRKIGADDLDQGLSNALLARQDRQRVAQNPAWLYVGTYIDEEGERTAFEKMMSEARSGKVDLIETESVTAFDMEDLTTATEKLSPVRIHFETEGITIGMDEWKRYTDSNEGFMT